MARIADFTNEQGTEFNDFTLQKLEGAFLKGMTNREACFLAGISESLFYAVCKLNGEYLERFKLLQENVKARAKEVVAEKIDTGCIDTAKWYLERKDKDFKTKADITSDDKPIPILNYVQQNNSDRQDNSPEKEIESSMRGDISQQDNLNPAILDTPVTDGQNT